MVNRTIVDVNFYKEVGQTLVLSLFISGIWPLAALAEPIDLAPPPPEQTHAATSPQLQASPGRITPPIPPHGDLDLALSATSISVLPLSKLQQDLTFPTSRTPDPPPASHPSIPNLHRPPRTLDEAGWTPTLQTVIAVPAPPVPDPSTSIDAPPSAQVQTSNASPQAADLRISPRVGVGASSPSSGTETTTRLETFLPIWQQSGQSLSFLEGRLLIDDRGNPGGNVLIGYRQYRESLNRTLGAYLGFDIRNTDNHTFQQLGLGFESLGDDVDLYLNGFWPIGTTQQQTGQLITDTGLQLNGDPRFAGNALLLDLQRQRRITRQFEEALAGVDFEVGKQLLRFKNGGDLQAFLGPYFLHSGIRGNTFGARLRLQMQPTRNISAGVGIQHDAFFGTHVLGNLTFTWPGNRPKEPITPDNTVVARMGSSVNRTNNVIVDTPTTTEVLETENRTVAALNPATGQPWFFTHVNLGLGNSDGTFESPFGTVAEALAATQGDGNDIVYVAQGTNPQIPAFTVPDNVQARSQGPIQRIEVSPIASQLSTPSTLNLGTVQLPASGNGQFPTVTGTVTMRNNTLLSGFAINPNGANGVEAVGVQNVVIDQNQITNADNGIRLQDLTGDVVITNNVVDQTDEDGINLGLDNTNINSILISGNTVSNANDDGIGIDVYNSGQLNLVTISGNTVSDAGVEADGINLYVAANGQVNTATISGNRVSNVSNTGIDVYVYNNGQIDAVNISGNTVTSVESRGIDVYAGYGAQLGTVTISGNTLSSGSDGIRFGLYTNSQIGTATISGNTVSTVISDGIRFGLYTNSQIGTATISGNTVSTLDDDGFRFNLERNSQIGTATILGNTVSAREAGFRFDLERNSQIDTATISGNTVTTSGNGADGIYVNAVGSFTTINTANITGNTISTMGNNADGIYVNADGSFATINTANITGNTISTIENSADGIFVNAEDNSTINTANITGNMISTTGTNADGIRVENSDGATINTANITGNTISTTGTNADGIFVYVNNGAQLGEATISGNTVTTSGNNADGIEINNVFFAQGTTVELSDNIILQAGRHSIMVFNDFNSSICTSFSGNRSDNPAFATASGTDFNLISRSNSTFQVVNLATVSADNNNAVFNFDGTLVPPGTPPAAFTNVASCP